MNPVISSIFTFVALFVLGLDYIRAEGFVFSHVADEGLMNACAGPLLRYRKQIGADNIQIFTDIKKKHRYMYNKKYEKKILFNSWTVFFVVLQKA